MDLRVLKYFLAIAREQSIVRAAESLHLSQPTLTEEGMILRKRAEHLSRNPLPYFQW